MPEGLTELGRFALGIKIFRNSDGSISYQTKDVNEGVPIEIVIMQIKAFLKDLEDNYYQKYEKRGE